MGTPICTSSCVCVESSLWSAFGCSIVEATAPEMAAFEIVGSPSVW
jgi:hypothetical protein